MVVQRGLATAEQVEKAIIEGRARGEPLCTRLLAAGIDESELASVLSEKHGVPAVDLSRTAVAVELLDLIPRAVAEGDLILPLSLEGDRLHLAMARPADERVLAEVRFVTGLEASPYVACRGALLHAIGEAYAARARGVALWRGRVCASGTPHIEAVIGGEVMEVVDSIPDAEIVIEIEAAAPERARKGPLVLVVDDEPEILQLVERTLRAKGYEVELAQDGAEGLAKADELVPDLVLLDAMLPKVHGFEACRRIKASPRTRNVPVVMMTAIYRGWRFAQDAKDSYGAEDYVEKPFRLDDLLRRVEEALLSGGARAAAASSAPAEEGADPRLARGKELLAAGRLAEAIATLSEVVREDPHSPDAHFQLGRALHAGGDAFGAMTALERAAELAPGHLAALRALATLYEQTGFRRKAAEVLERALPAAPDDD
ncbi:MAG TPA: response regulator, partial [Anaeromyxobacter sp.]